MKPSLHVQVSELVMGWQRTVNNTRGSGKYWWVDPGRPGLCLGNPYSQPVRPNQHWNPTKDANHALEVSRRMCHLGFLVRIEIKDDAGHWEVVFTSPAMLPYRAYAPSLPLAICQAAVKALAP